MEENKQEIFNKVVVNLAKQGQPSIAKRLGGYDNTLFAGCQYRLIKSDTHTLKCGIGWLIEDEKYTPEMEGASASGLARRGLLGYSVNFAESFLDPLQNVHDSVATWGSEANFKKNFSGFADMFKLDTTILHTLPESFIVEF